MGIFEKREAYKPFEYPEVTKFTDAMSKSYWVHSEVEFTADVQDYKSNLTDVEREALKRSLLGIAQIEVAVKTFWGDLYKLFPKPEFNNLGMSFGESECFDKYTEILTNNGFKRFEDLTEEDKVAQYNMEDKSISFVKPLRHIKRYYKGEMHHYDTSYMDLMVTPNHEVVAKRDGSNKFRKIKSCNLKYRENNVFPVSGYKDGDAEFTTLDRLLVAIYSVGEFRSIRGFLGWSAPSSEFGLVFDPTMGKEKTERIEGLLKELSIEYEKRNIDDCEKIVITEAHLGDIYLVPKVKDLSYINLENVSKGWIDEFFNELEYWNRDVDGLFIHRHNVEKSIDTISILCTLSGRVYQKSEALHNAKYGRYWCIMINEKDECGYSQKEEVEYDNFVYCVEVPTGCVVVRRNGKSYISGNCRHSEAYARLLEVLGHVNEFEHILDIPVFKKRYHVLKDYLNENKDNIMEKLLFFTLVVENASLFSQFATILYFSRFKGYMKNVANMIAWSSTDEACLKLNTEVLTPQGWRFIKDMKVGDDIYGFKEGVLRNEKVLKTIRKPFKGSFYIIHNHGGHKCLSMTPDHEVIYKRDGLWDKVYACNFRPAIGTWLPAGVDYGNPSENTKKFTDLDFLKFIMSTAGKKVGIDARTVQYKYEVTPCDSLSSEVIERVLKSLKISYEKTIFIPDEVEQIRLKRRPSKITFSHDLFFNLNDYTWVDFENIGQDYVKDFFDKIVVSYLLKNEEYGFRVYKTTNKKNLDVIQRLSFLAGHTPQIENDSLRFGFIDKLERSDIYKVTKGQYREEDVVCVTVPSGGIVVRQEDDTDPFIIGNCHAQAGTWILSKIFEEQPKFREKAEKEATVFIQEYIKMEDELLDWIFEKGELEKVSKKDLGNYMRYRLNNSFLDLKLKPPFELTEEDIKPMMWFEEEVFSNELDDFFAKRPTAYTKHDKSITADSLF